MALAVLTIESTSADAVEAIASIGSNNVFEYLVGRHEGATVGSRWGDEELSEVSHRSGLQAAPEGFDPFSRQFRFTVPLALFDRHHPHLQLISYSDRGRNCPARSRILRVAPVMAASYPLALSPRPLTSEPARSVRRVPLSFQESALSRAQFVDGLLQVLQAVAPTLIQALPQLIGSGASGTSSGGGGSGAPNGLSTDLLVQLLRQLVAALPAAAGSPPPTPAPSPPPLAAAATLRRAAMFAGGPLRHPLGRALQQRRYATALQAPRVPFGRAMDGGLLSGPMLATLLAPLLSQAPQLLGVLADKPLDFLATLLRNEAQNDLQREANQQAFIRHLLAETNRSLLLDQLVQRMGRDGAASLLPLLTQSQSLRAQPKVEASQAFTLKFVMGQPIEMGAKLKAVFASTGQGIDLRIVLQPTTGNVPQTPLPKAQAELVVTDPQSGDCLLTRAYRLTEIHAGEPVPLHLEDELLSRLPRHRDLQVTVKLRWPAAQGRVLGVRGHHAICLADSGPLFGGFGASRDRVFHLADPSTFRSFWNRIWEGSTPTGTQRSRWEIDVLCRYYVRVIGLTETNGRMETRIATAGNGTTSAEGEITGKMRAGMEFSIDMLNQVLAEQSSPLSAMELTALRQADLRGEMDMEATTRLRLRGKDAQIGAIWVFPSLMLRDIHFLEPVARDPHGQVTEVKRSTRTFPMPDRLHFLMLRSKS
jgi:hypothetical protein